MVRRVFTEKKAGFDVAAQGIAADLRENLRLKSLSELRLFSRYDVTGLTEEEFELACEQVFAEPAVDWLYRDELPWVDGLAFAVEYLPGQFDQRADSAAQCIQLITQKERPLVRSARIYILCGVDEEELQRVRDYLINPVDSREAAFEKPESLDLDAPVPGLVPVLDGFCAMSEADLRAMHREMSLAMSPADLLFVRGYFKREGRDPSETELRVIDTYWSDHCRHTTFLTRLRDIDIVGADEDAAIQCAVQRAFDQYAAARAALYGKKTDRPITLMDMATVGAKWLIKSGAVQDVDQSEEINACSIRVEVEIEEGDNVRKVPYLIMFKNETHNHPTEIEPFGGAATCLGGAIRDPLSGRSYVYQAMRVTGAGDVRTPNERTLPGKLSQRQISVGAAAGYSSYGNQIGLATGLVREITHEGYIAKRMEIGAVIAAAPSENVRRERPAEGDVVLLLGGATGRDGIGGATGSSQAHTQESIHICGAQVQKGDPLVERKLQRLFRNKDFTTRVKRCNDFGAGGVCVAIGELADGLCIDLDAVPKKYEGLDGTELAISESQERMAVVVAPEDAAYVETLAGQENVMCSSVALVTGDARLVMRWRGQTIVDIARDFLDTNGVEQTADAALHLPCMSDSPFLKTQRVSSHALMNALGGLNACSQKGLIERFDASIGAGTVLMPFGGRTQRTPAHVMASLVPVLQGECRTATLMSYGFDPYLSSWSPFHGASHAVVHSLAKIVAAGGDYRSARLSFQEYFERLGSDAARWGKPVLALLGALSAQLALGVPAIGGKDSMSGSFGELDVPPTLVSFAVAPVPAGRVVSNEFMEPNHVVALFPARRDEAGLPDYKAVQAQFLRAQELIGNQKALRAGAIDTLITSVIPSCFGNEVGFAFAPLEGLPDLFAPGYGGVWVELAEGEPVPVEAVLLGHTLRERVVRIGDVSYALDTLWKAWQGPLEKVFPTQVSQDTPIEPQGCFETRTDAVPKVKTLRPRAVIPVFPGTNCEYDTARALDRAGGEADIFVIRNATSAQIEQSVLALSERLDKAQMMILPGGFSGGDEPDGSGKFIMAVLRAPRMQEAIHRLLYQRDGLMLGICNGFQALIKLGLVPYGEIRAQRGDSPTLTHNNIARHVSRMVKTRVTSVLSPWFGLCESGETHTIPVSHGEGRFVASVEEIRWLFQNGQVATQYVDDAGRPSMDIEHNPNGSYYAVEGITSPDGRILGKMGHSERVGKYLYRNIEGDFDQKLFASGVRYFV